jgi:hypothetical protein
MTGRFRVLLREVCISVHESFCNSECGMRIRTTEAVRSGKGIQKSAEGIVGQQSGLKARTFSKNQRRSTAGMEKRRNGG